ncbi:MAG: precorrin-6y C5,15-methyltransferase (decarboxylating) subunit CbiE [Pirellulales bacterium]|nr:precorrin-6y C5,15-methyltransferase (decarboxylating) subunit CbiE [Pirellulales bacterium]
MTQHKVRIIGVGDDGLEGLTSKAREEITQAQVLLGSENTLALIPATTGQSRHVLHGNLTEIVDRINAAAGQRTVLLASGDPLFYGVARYLCDRLGKDRFEVLPHVSSMQMAFARVKESWEEAFLTNLNLHGLENALSKIRVADKVGLFTSEEFPPRVIAQTLLSNRLDYFYAYVCENLGSRDERVTQGELAEIARQDFSPLNVLILVRKPERPDRPIESGALRLFGNPDECFLQSRPKQGLLTPAEVRSVALAQLELSPHSVVWDVGAGSGSVAVEAANIANQGTVYAIEQDIEDHQLIVANAERFAVKNLRPVLGRAPEAWEKLPAPDAVFVGGSGREVARLVELVYERLQPGGRLVCNVGSIENLSSVHELLNRRVPDVRVWMINVARGVFQLERVRFDALNPTFLLAVTKPGK